ncbi:lycopene cyclase domain-containing protein [Georgenia sp. 10Sc9-8]|uniref:Lycopene cyclase domain-containing protein n=1 Tax=Georgenia halotolerans TaxID=3028317 RepID=A0ABT5TYT8_9MICO|nr:lycopene cyclase domain-containing protein [Georgenia halotolerans]
MTYLLLNAPFLALAVALAVVARLRVRRPAALPVLVTVALLAVMTAVFDNLMIAAGLFEYADDRRSGLSLGRAPLEDFAYPVAGALLLPAMWHLLRPGAQRAARAAGGSPAAGTSSPGGAPPSAGTSPTGREVS